MKDLIEMISLFFVLILLLLAILGQNDIMRNAIMWFGCLFLGGMFLLGIVSVFAYIFENKVKIPLKYEDDEIKRFTKYNKPVDYLENENVLMYFNNYGNGYCIRVKDKVKFNKIIEVATPISSNIIATIWIHFQKNFSDKTTYNIIKIWLYLYIFVHQLINVIKIKYN